MPVPSSKKSTRRRHLKSERLRAISESQSRLMPASPAQAREKLEAIALDLHEHNFDWPAAALSAFLVGKCSSLDEAFGLMPKPKRGRPGTDGVATRVLEIFNHRLKGESWEKIASELGGDERELRRIYGTRRTALISGEIDRRLTKKPPYRRPKPGV